MLEIKGLMNHVHVMNVTLTHSHCVFSSLPSLDKETKEKVDKDIESARKWIKEYL